MFGEWRKEKTKLGYSLWYNDRFPDYYIEQSNVDGTVIVRSKKPEDELNPTKFTLNPMEQAQQIVAELSSCDNVVLFPLSG